MALSGAGLKAVMKASVDAIDQNNGAITNDAVLEALANAIIDYIKSNGQVLVTSGSSAGAYNII